jgi:8-oxo-dGTP pyrophosphatase MutT (NUDIX family)
VNLNTKKDFSVGVIVFYKKSEQVEYLILKHKQGHWTFSKGHAEAGEKKSDTALRELSEETEITDIEFLHDEILLNEKYEFKNKKDKLVFKSVDYFIAETKDKDVRIDGTEILDYRWCSFQSALNTITFNESKKLLRKANKIVLNKNAS